MAPSLSSAFHKLIPSRKRDSLKNLQADDQPSSKHSSRSHSTERSSIDNANAEKADKLGDLDSKFLKQEREIEDERRIRMKRAQSSQIAVMTETPEQRERYGEIDYDAFEPEDGIEEILIQDLSDDSRLGKTVDLRVRLHTIRALSSALIFLVLRQQTHTIQGVLAADDELGISSHMVRWVSRLQEECILHVKGVLQKPKLREGDGQVHATSIHNMELRILEVHVISKVAEPVPFSVYEADLSAKAKTADSEYDDSDDGKGAAGPYISDRARLNSRIMHLRSAAAQSVFRVQSTMSTVFRSHLASLGTPDASSATPPREFIEIHTPKLQGGASESGASVFKLKYFGRVGFLAQSPQLFKQMSIAADFGGTSNNGGVFEIGPVFRAENSNTHRHLTEYTGLDIEMVIQRHYHEVMRTVDSTLKAIFKAVYETRRREIEIIKTQFPLPDLVWLDETPVIIFADGVQMLIDSGWTDDEGNKPKKDEDLSTRAEIRLGELVKEKYHTDYYILDQFPKSARPFYTMPASAATQASIRSRHPDAGDTTNSFDIFVRGQEITTGGQRIHDYETLIQAMAENGISERGLEDYLDGFRWGAPPHGGAGIGLERLVMLVLGLSDIRFASMYPRDPKSLPEPPKGLEGLPHPEASTAPVASKNVKMIKCICQSQFRRGGDSLGESLGASQASLGFDQLSLDKLDSGSPTPMRAPSPPTISGSGTSTPHSIGTTSTAGSAVGSTFSAASTGSKVRHPPHHVGPSPLHQSAIPNGDSAISSALVSQSGTIGGGGSTSVIGGAGQSSFTHLNKTYPPLPKLIANYGDAANTSWLDDRYLVWRDGPTGAAIGFVPSSGGFSIIVGDPLCEKSQYAGVVGRFLGWCRKGEKGESDDHEERLGFIERKQITSSESDNEGKKDKPLGPLKPVWLLASSDLESVLGARLGWSSFTCIAESRVELEGEVPSSLDEKEVKKKVRRAEAEGVHVATWLGRDGFVTDEVEQLSAFDQHDGIFVQPSASASNIPALSANTVATSGGSSAKSNGMPLSVKHAIDSCIAEWREGRRKKGGQVRLTEVEVWRDFVHRQYFVAMGPKKRREEEEAGSPRPSMDVASTQTVGKDGEKVPVALVVLHQLSPKYGFQVKYALDFANSPSGSIEAALSAAMHAVASTGSGRLTFGTSATSRLTAVRNVAGVKVKVLSHAYEAISEKMKLHGKGDFRRKMGAEEEDVYICFPRGGLGGRGAKAVLDFCVAEN
ncbi:hypothetical protein GYMLUDRAFT_41440 [Collybiopsis luxurians FD-317 M1]|uniref:Probable aspartate--tRNA ligase, cytoplasmic n=1 Tax=Collybiopsis luxurians FD-317 M1 TaxID=944289 RepID=A0A0D0C4R3_9AGAR|nr:hypothetical protein GYMLUDRAFT_41440 [Collybiopsis luxurians FD-317 M1]